MTPEEIRGRIALILGFTHHVPTEEEAAEGHVEVWRYRCPEGGKPVYGVVRSDAYDLPHFEADPGELGWLVGWVEAQDLEACWVREEGGRHTVTLTGIHNTWHEGDCLSLALCMAILAYVDTPEPRAGERLGVSIAPGWMGDIAGPGCDPDTG